jgi:peroxiredoxin
MCQKFKLILKGLIVIKKAMLLLIAATLILSSCQSGSQEQVAEKVMSDFTLITPDSVEHSLSQYRGQYVLVHFWADMCSGCRAEFPEMENGYQALKSQNFIILAVNAGQPFDHVAEIRDTYGLTFPVLVDEEAKTAKEMAISGVPYSFMLDKQGKIRKELSGYLDEKLIAELFAAAQN